MPLLWLVSVHRRPPPVDCRVYPSNSMVLQIITAKYKERCWLFRVLLSSLVRNNTSEDLVTLLHCSSKHWNSQKHRTSTISIVGGCVHKHKGLQVLEQSHCYIWSHHLMQLTTRSRRFLARAVLLGKWRGGKRVHFIKVASLTTKTTMTL